MATSTIQAFADSYALNPLDPKDLIQTFGVVGVIAIIFAETGLLLGFFFPGDSLLFLAGVAASPVAERLVGTTFPLPVLLIATPIAAIVGAQLGHFLGARAGHAMFDRPNSRLFKREYVEKAEHYFNRFGPAKAVVLARFIPIVRTFLNPVAGILEMPARRFFVWNLLGGLLWTEGVLIAGYQLADSIPASVIDRYLLPVVALIVLVSVSPMLVELWRGWRQRRRDRQPAHGNS